MKKMKKIMVTFVSAFVFMLMSSLMVFAAVETEAGATVTVTFAFTDAAGVRGTIHLSNPGMFASTEPEISVSTGSPVTFNPGNGKFAFSLAEPTSGTISLKYKVSDSAQPGDSCDITISDLKKPLPDFSADTDHDPSSMTEEVVIPKSVQPTPTPDPGDDDDDDDDDDPTPTAAPTPKPTVAPTPVPTSPVTSTMPAKEVDYTKLKEAIDSANKLVDSDEVSKLWNKLFTAVSNGTLLLASDNQAAVDEAATEILGLIDQIKAYLEAANTTQEVVKEVEVEPEGDYCNIAMHKVWPILFFVSLVVNVLLGVCVVASKKKVARDNTPLVDYQISDDDE